MASKKPDPLEAYRTPKPADDLKVTFIKLPKATRLHRVHVNKYDAIQFNSTCKGNARFSPIKDKDGNIIPTIYAGSKRECAMMETIYHDVPYSSGFKSFDEGKLENQVHSELTTKKGITLANLGNIPLRKMGVTRAQLIETEKDQYPDTRKWAEAIHNQCPDVQGLQWVSRQDDSANALVLFGDRITDGTLEEAGPSKSLTGDSATRDAVSDLAERIGVTIIPRVS